MDLGIDDSDAPWVLRFSALPCSSVESAAPLIAALSIANDGVTSLRNAESGESVNESSSADDVFCRIRAAGTESSYTAPE